MTKKQPPRKAKEPQDIPGMRAYLSIIGTAGGIASGASRREDRELAKAGKLDAAGLEALRRRSELARKAALSRWAKRRNPVL